MQLGSKPEPGENDEEPGYRLTVSPLENGPIRPRTDILEFKGSRTGFAVSDDGRYVAVGTDAGDVYLWDLQAALPERRELQPRHAGRVPALAFSRDGAMLATGSHDETIRLWNVSSGKPHQPPRQAGSRVNYVRFDRSGTRLAALYDFSVGEPPALQLWDVAAGIPIGAPLRGADQSSIGNVVAFSRNGRWVVAGGDDKEIVLSDTAVAAWRAHACRLANRNLSPTEEWPIYYHKTCAGLPLPIHVPRIRHNQEEETF